MKIGKIEEGIPLANKAKGGSCKGVKKEISWNLGEMKVGQSFLFSGSHTRLNSAMQSAKKKYGYQFAYRRIRINYRCWRVA